MDKQALDRYLSQSDEDAHPEWFEERNTGATQEQIEAAAERSIDGGWYSNRSDAREAGTAWASFLVSPDHRIIPLAILQRMIADVTGYKSTYTTADDINIVASLIRGD